MPKTPGFFVGKAIVITGAGSGVGRAAAGIFAREGAKVVCVDIDAGENEKTAAVLREKGKDAIAIQTDVTSRDQVEAMFQQVVERYGQISFLFNSAGAAFRRASFLEIDDDLFNRTFDLNVKGTFFTMQTALPHMLKNGYGVIVNIASMSHKRGGPGSSIHYASSKGAVLTMTLGVAREFADRGIRCLSISPSSINTNFQSSANTSPEAVQRFLADIPMKRYAEPEEIGELALFMCSDACEFMTADTVYVSGGGGWR